MIRFEVYYDCKTELWTWRALDANYNIVADGHIWLTTSQAVVDYLTPLRTAFFHSSINVVEGKPLCARSRRWEQQILSVWDQERGPN